MKWRTYIAQLYAVALVLVSMSTQASAQPEYFMQDTTVTDCEGVLYDSEQGDLTGHYDHNEDYTFTICITGADDILLDFNFFHSEEDYDFITFYDGPDNTAPVIAGPFSGRVTIPTIIATSGCLTVHFSSDANVAEPGWRATWRTSNFSPPTPPDLTLITVPSCPLQELVIELDRPVHCDSLYVGAVALTGPKIVDITSVDAINCNGDSTTQFRVRFAPALDFSGRYTLELRTIVPYCTTPYILYSEVEFRLQGCPLAIRLSVDDDEGLCSGDFARITADVSGGIRGTYRYTWSPVASRADTVRIGPLNGATTVRVDVVDAAGNAATASIVVEPLPSPVIVGGNRSMCQSVAPFELRALPPHGEWDAAGLFYGYDRSKGLYDPQLTDGSSDIITYTAPNGCTSQVTYTFTPLDYGTDDGACLGANPFDVSGGTPAGGVWSGPNIASDGRFTPPGDTGTWRVTYTHPNGCSGSKDIHVGIETPIVQDTFCESVPRVTLQISPRGGVWTGPGMSFGSRGWFSPGSAGAGPHTLNYFAEGCADREVEIFVKEIDAFDGFTACPIEDPRILPGNWRPAGGTWYGRGIIDPTDGLFDPGLFGEGSDTLTYHAPNGCTDRRTVSVYFTFTRPQDDTLEMCTDDAPMRLTPGGRIFQRPLDVGRWSGSGVSYANDGRAYFDPRVAGLGLHQITYTANTCEAHNWVQVGQSPEWYGDTLCVGSDPVQLSSAAANTEWAGQGIINGIDGIFDVEEAGVGLHEISAFSAEGCRQTANILVPAAANLSFTAPAAVACFSDSLLNLELTPAATLLSEAGSTLPQNLSPAALGEGLHNVVLRAGTPGCEDIDSFSLEVLPPLRLSAKPYTDSLCFGDGTSLGVAPAGGMERDWQVRWSDLPNWPLYERQVLPQQNTTYRATLSDGCSNDVTLNLPVVVHPQVDADVDEGDTVCSTDSTSTLVIPLGSSRYEVKWYVPGGPHFGEFYAGTPGYYDVEVLDEATGCTHQLEARLPGWPVVAASFSPSPTECILPGSDGVTLLDRSRGATKGTWFFPDGSTRAYEQGRNETMSFADTGYYEVKLLLENEGGCTSRDSVTICVHEPTKLYLPTAFTPNGDGLNDTYRITGQGIYDIEWVIVDRWGTIVFEGNEMDDAWDGTYKNQLLAQAQFTLRAKYINESGREEEAQAVLWLMRQ